MQEYPEHHISLEINVFPTQNEVAKMSLQHEQIAQMLEAGWPRREGRPWSRLERRAEATVSEPAQGRPVRDAADFPGLQGGCPLLGIAAICPRC